MECCYMDKNIVQTSKDLESYAFFMKNDFHNHRSEWENDNVDACLEAAMACLDSMGNRSAELNLLYDNLDAGGLRFAAILLLAAVFKVPIDFVTQNINEEDFLTTRPKGAAFAVVCKNKWEILCDAGFQVEESMDCFFDKIISLLRDKEISGNESLHIQISPNILTFIAHILDLGKYYE